MPGAGQEGVEAGHATIEGWEAKEASSVDAMDVDRSGQVLTHVCVIV